MGMRWAREEELQKGAQLEYVPSVKRLLGGAHRGRHAEASLHIVEELPAQSSSLGILFQRGRCFVQLLLCTTPCVQCTVGGEQPVSAQAERISFAYSSLRWRSFTAESQATLLERRAKVAELLARSPLREG